MAEKEKSPKDLAKKEVNKRVAKALADIEIERRRLKARIKKLDRVETKILNGDIVPNADGSLPNDDEDEDNSSSSSDLNSHVAILLDESGSMHSCRDQVIEGFNGYIYKLKKQSPNIKMTLTKFDSRAVNTVFKNRLIEEVPKLNENTYKPNACTPLYDAIGKTINEIKELSKVLFVIQTDGLENDSKEYTLDSVKKLIQKKEKTGWEFVYLGSNIDAWNQGGRQLGLSSGSTYSYDSMDTHDTFASGLACFTSSWNDGGVIGSQFKSAMSDNKSKRNKRTNK